MAIFHHSHIPLYITYPHIKLYNINSNYSTRPLPEVWSEEFSNKTQQINRKLLLT